MVRICVLLDTNDTESVKIYIDQENHDAILQYLSQDEPHKKKWRYISGLIKEGIKNTELYDREDVSEIAKDVTAMKFFKGGENYRIYCKEYWDGRVKKIVMARLFQKKTNKMDLKTKTIIETIGGYQYEFDE